MGPTQGKPRAPGSTLKGVRISLDTSRDTRKGFGVQSLSHLQDKVRVTFQIEPEAKLHLFLPDGTEVDDEDYFLHLPQQIHLIASTKSSLQTSNNNENVFDNFLKLLRSQQGTPEVMAQIRELLLQGSGDSCQDLVDRWRKMSDYVEGQNLNKARFSKPDEDPKWFESLSTNAKSKEEYLSKSCQARIRGYLAKAESQLRAPNRITTLSREDFDVLVEDTLSEFRSTLKLNGYYGHYFDRKSQLSTKLCNPEGEFGCQGRYDAESCSYNKEKDRLQAHTINPYESAEARIMFSTWNLDHVIERSRSVVPSLVQAIARSEGQSINVQYFHNLLFTRQNLKLVHIVCHDKQEHSGKKCDPKCFYIAKNKLDKISKTKRPNYKNKKFSKKLFLETPKIERRKRKMSIS